LNNKISTPITNYVYGI